MAEIILGMGTTYGPCNIGHAYDFVVRHILCDKLMAIVPVLIVNYIPPIMHTARRYYGYGRAMGWAIKSWDSDARVAVCASDGMSHFVIDEAPDRRLIESLQSGDEKALTSGPKFPFAQEIRRSRTGSSLPTSAPRPTWK